MYKLEKLMRLLWLLNAQTNSLLEPKLLTVQALEKARDFKTELKNLKLSDEEKTFVIEELKNALSYMKDVMEKVEQLEKEISNALDIVE